MNSSEFSTIRVLIVDDQSLIRQGLKAMLELEPHLQVVGDAENGKVALELIAALQPDVVLMDITMPEMDGQTATKLIVQNFPNVKVLILSTFDEDSYITEAVRSGARGYLLKDVSWRELVSAIRFVHLGYTQFGPGLFDKLLITAQPVISMHRATSLSQDSTLPKLAELTPREQEVLQWLGTGATNREIAERLYITEGTVKTYVTNLLNRLSLRNRSQLALYANSVLAETPQLPKRRENELMEAGKTKLRQKGMALV
jgi:DNA-binding NarL/FixJ family response regulator